MAKLAPFSITPDAEDYIRSQLDVMPPEAEPVIVMETKLGEPLDERGKKIRWWYEGENFLICYFDPAEKPQTEQIEFLRRSVSITPEALKQLAGQTLTLRRVNSGYGLINVPRYVLVADSAPDVSFENNDRIKNNFSIAALTVLGGFAGMGIIWLMICLIVPLVAPLLKPWLKISDDKLLSLIVPVFIICWIISAVISFFFFRSIYKAKGRTKFVQEQTQRKYLGYGGLNADLSMWIFFGIPIPLIIVLVMFFEHFAHTTGQETAAAFVGIAIVFIPAMYFCDRIKHRIVIRLGLLGWALTIIGGYWYFKTYGP
jgi:hypothetical protein